MKPMKPMKDAKYKQIPSYEMKCVKKVQKRKYGCDESLLDHFTRDIYGNV